MDQPTPVILSRSNETKREAPGPTTRARVQSLLTNRKIQLPFCKRKKERHNKQKVWDQSAKETRWVCVCVHRWVLYFLGRPKRTERGRRKHTRTHIVEGTAAVLGGGARGHRTPRCTPLQKLYNKRRGEERRKGSLAPFTQPSTHRSLAPPSSTACCPAAPP
jgi:hypothetical protein